MRVKVVSMDDEEKPDWLTEMDEEILEILSTGLTLGPTAIAENIDRSREGVSNRLNSLQAGGLVEKVGRGKYKLADYEGSYFEVVEVSDEERKEAREKDQEKREKIKEDLGVTVEEYQNQVREEHERIQEEEPECDDPLSKAFEIVEERLREDNKDT
jgi:DNA-binding Lrp family transcriptional regulator